MYQNLMKSGGSHPSEFLEVSAAGYHQTLPGSNATAFLPF